MGWGSQTTTPKERFLWELSFLVQAPNQRLAHPCHAQHTEAPAFQLVQDYARRVIDIVLATVKRRKEGLVRPGHHKHPTELAFARDEHCMEQTT